MRVIILAAGHGKRMEHELPKPLVPLSGKPIVSYLLASIKESGVCGTPIIVVSPDRIDTFKEILGEDYEYVIQKEQLGTGHAVLSAKGALEGVDERILVLYGDHPWVSAETIKKIAERSEDSNRVLTLATAVVEDFQDWRAGFESFGRILRDENDYVTRIVEKKDATEEEQAIKEVNPAYFCFKPEWLWSRLEKIKNENVQHEYYLTDLVQIAVSEGEAIATVQIDPREALGINTKEQLALCEALAEN